MKACSVSLSK